MHRRVLFFSCILLLVLAVVVTRAQDDDDSGDGDDTTTDVTSTNPTGTGSTGTNPTGTSQGTTKSSKKTTKKKKYNYGSYGSGYGSKNKNKGYGKYGKGNNDNNYEVVGTDGNDPNKDGTDFGDFGPITDNKKSMLSQLDVFISSADDWQKNGKGDGYGYDDGDNGYRNKRSYKKVRFPVKRVKNYRNFPIRRFPPLISIFPWVPIFYDKLTYQTIIFSPTGGLYIIPPLINFYGQRFAVAQLIKWGYASLVSSGAPVGPGVDVAPLVQPAPAGGVVAAGVAGGAGGGPAPTFDSNKARFNGGVKTDFRDFKPRYSQTLEEGGSGNYGPPAARSNYGADSNYGGTNNQQVYAQGG